MYNSSQQDHPASYHAASSATMEWFLEQFMDGTFTILSPKVVLAIFLVRAASNMYELGFSRGVRKSLSLLRTHWFMHIPTLCQRWLYYAQRALERGSPARNIAFSLYAGSFTFTCVWVMYIKYYEWSGDDDEDNNYFDFDFDIDSGSDSDSYSDSDDNLDHYDENYTYRDIDNYYDLDSTPQPKAWMFLAAGVTFLLALEFSGFGEKEKAIGRMIPWRVARAIWNHVDGFPSALFFEVWMDGEVAKVNGTGMGESMGLM